MHRAVRWLLVVPAFAALLGCGHPKSYTHDTLVRNANLTPHAVNHPDNSTPADPYPPPRPILPDDPSHVAETVIQTPERTPVRR